MPGRPSWTLASRGLHECSAWRSGLRMSYTRQPVSHQDGSTHELTTMDSYDYMPLQTPDSIPVLTLKPGLAEDLRGHLIHQKLSDDPDFVALSYCWGEPIFDAEIDCDGQHINITSDPAAALTKLRGQTHTLTIWIDLVCIDQRNIPEWDAQVLLMGQIYSTASKVIVWLGTQQEGNIPRQQHGPLMERFSAWIGEESEADVTSLRLQSLHQTQQRRLTRLHF